MGLSALAGLTVVNGYPRTSTPDGTAIERWGYIPGAKNCTPQLCGFRDHFEDLKDAGAAHVLGLSAQSSDHQSEVIQRLHLPLPLLSDEALELRQALDLPVFKAGGMTLLVRVTFIFSDGVIEHTFVNLEDPADNAAAVFH